MFDYESQLRALAENFGLEFLLEENDISEERVIDWLITEGLINPRDYINLEEEERWWKGIEE